ncbi:hypothetical protein [Dongshaea marina]|uniref:hypothetical protein n=1 Tax=Dongshaea marina TaxID=2047966 RepID=UPI000D3ED067|nr:hypothetical protein [Dongshaea marina]
MKYAIFCGKGYFKCEVTADSPKDAAVIYATERLSHQQQARIVLCPKEREAQYVVYEMDGEVPDYEFEDERAFASAIPVQGDPYHYVDE